MSPTPEWPDGDGPRILKLVGNDITIDGRVRKTASSLARSGFRVVVLGVDILGNAWAHEDLDGAHLYRVQPPTDPRVSTRLARLSRAELGDSYRYRTELLRRRLQLARRDLLWVVHTQKVATRQNALPSRLTRSAKTLKAISLQRRFQLNRAIYRFLARRPQKSMLQGKWRRDLPELHRYEASLGSLVDTLEPDLVHAHDVILLGVAVRAKARAAAAGRSFPVVYDAHEHIPGLPIDDRRRTAYTDLEEEHAPHTDGMVAVSPGLMKLLESRFGVKSHLVLNAPDETRATETTPIREVASIPPEAKVMVYVGGIAPHRGAETLIDTLSHLPGDVHLIFVSAKQTKYIDGLIERARERGTADRVHTVPYVRPEAVISYIAGSDVSVIPLSRDILNYEIALPNKLFQAIHAGVPVAVSDNPDMARFVKEHRIGEVFDGSSPQAIANAVSRILDDPEPYRRALKEPALLKLSSWSDQMDRLSSLYASLGVTTRAR